MTDTYSIWARQQTRRDRAAALPETIKGGQATSSTVYEPMLLVEGLEKRYGAVHALKGIDLQISRGEILTLLGPNGAGKSTLVSIVAGLLRPDAGRAWIDGVDVHAQSRASRRRIGLAPQETGIYWPLSVEENLRYFGEIAGQGRKALAERLEQLAEAFALRDLMRRPARTLSGGEQRRLHTAMSMVNRPELLLLDEPTTGADAVTRATLLEVVRELAQNGTAICYSTHYLSEVEQIAASVAILNEGLLVALDSVAGLISTYGESTPSDSNLPVSPACEPAGGEVHSNTAALHSNPPHRPPLDIERVFALLTTDRDPYAIR